MGRFKVPGDFRSRTPKGRLTDGFDVLSGLHLFQEYLGKPQLLEVQGIFYYQQASFLDTLGFENSPRSFEQGLIIGEGHRDRRSDGTTSRSNPVVCVA
jgi:hypothetical protein